jgi:hypothetical protein
LDGQDQEPVVNVPMAVVPSRQKVTWLKNPDTDVKKQMGYEAARKQRHAPLREKDDEGEGFRWEEGRSEITPESLPVSGVTILPPIKKSDVLVRHDDNDVEMNEKPRDEGNPYFEIHEKVELAKKMIESDKEAISPQNIARLEELVQSLDTKNEEIRRDDSDDPRWLYKEINGIWTKVEAAFERAGIFEMRLVYKLYLYLLDKNSEQDQEGGKKHDPLMATLADAVEGLNVLDSEDKVVSQAKEAYRKISKVLQMLGDSRLASYSEILLRHGEHHSILEKVESKLPKNLDHGGNSTFKEFKLLVIAFRNAVEEEQQVKEHILEVFDELDDYRLEDTKYTSLDEDRQLNSEKINSSLSALKSGCGALIISGDNEIMDLAWEIDDILNR